MIGKNQTKPSKNRPNLFLDKHFLHFSKLSLLSHS